MSADETRSSSNPKLQKLHLPTPKGDGEVLQVPPLNQIENVWQQNLALSQTPKNWVDESSFATLKLQARAELINSAIEYTHSYCDVPSSRVAPAADRPIVLAGHQPELFHPGVWYKNFVLSNLGERLNATSINLVIDNDLSTNHGIEVPELVNGNARTRPIPFDLSDEQIPHEERSIRDMDLFESFESRVADAIKPIGDRPIIAQLWPHVLTAAKALEQHDGTKLGASIAAGRHRLEVEFGLRNLEVPLSQVVSGAPFFHFLLQIVDDAKTFRTAYNESLTEYRTVNKLRSRSHPVPALEQIEAWTEVPFWVWHTNAPERKRLFVKTSNSESKHQTITLTDLNGWQTEFLRSDAVSQLAALAESGIKIRPRALMTTMYCRMFLSDLFVHGIGGAKYDQLTNLIAARFFGVRLPQYCAISATMHLPSSGSTVSATDINEAKQRLRKLETTPEKFIDLSEHPDAQSIIDSKQEWIQQTLPKNRMKERHQAIAQANQDLQPFVAPQKTALTEQLSEMTRQIENDEVLKSREVSFCLFPERLMKQLRAAASP